MGEPLHFGSREDLQFEEIEMPNRAHDTGSNAHISRQHSVVTQRQEGEAIQEVTRGCAV
ncbi:hypothetical protein PHLCEN_2v5655 [Hermanssonia centrifuga]|uniref:Uncharacterized protein n=1 Tax=Hermanssonia centrifuga TaxID=98765 RepID=A0A2R6P1S9_9APHY|nr:hypothetical protein PHLCEN_2v5655 [Hermanssonia centrifuga]